MKTIYFCIFLWVSFEINAQSDTTNLDLLRGPISPASSILGISSNDIQRSTDVKGFMMSLQNASQNFSVLPSSFAIDIAPYWLGKNGKRFSHVTNNTNTISKTFVISFATRNFQSKAKTDSTTQIGLGIRVSLIRGTYKQKIIDDINKSLTKRAKIVDAKIKSSEKYQELEEERKSINQKIIESRNINAPKSVVDSLRKLFVVIDSVQNELLKSINADLESKPENADLESKLKKVSEIKLIRTGLFIDLAGGISYNFAETKFDNAKIYKAGAWITFGNEWETGHSLLGIARFLYNPDKIFADSKGIIQNKTVNTWDFGLRYNYQLCDTPLNYGFEFIHRGVASSEIENSWRATLNASYEVSKNTVLTFSFGRDYDKTVNKDGNVIALLNLIKGFGGKN